MLSATVKGVTHVGLPRKERRRQLTGAALLLAAAIGAAIHLRRTGRDWRRRLFAGLYQRRARRAERGEIGQHRQRLIAHAQGRVLDLGAGTGQSFQHMPPTAEEVVAVEPDVWMLRHASRQQDDSPVPVTFVRAWGHALPFVEGSFDSAVVAHVLCTVDDLDATVWELRRVLRPGGRLLLMEHVRAADETLARLQDLVQRPWSWCNGGCRPNRDTLAALERAGFRLHDPEWYGYPVLPHVQGVAVRTA